jgi:hypothetical protein
MADYTLATLPPGIRDLIDMGYGFYFNTAAAGVTGAVAGTASAPMLWNPSDSDVRLKIIKVRWGGISGTVIAAHVAYGWLASAGAQIGTAQPVVSYTKVSPVNAVLGAGRASKINFAPATVTMTVGPAYLMPAGLNSPGAYAAGGLFTMVDNVDGGIIVNPGNAFFPYISNAAIALVAAVSVFALEIPISQPPG